MQLQTAKDMFASQRDRDFTYGKAANDQSHSLFVLLAAIIEQVKKPSQKRQQTTSSRAA